MQNNLSHSIAIPQRDLLSVFPGLIVSLQVVLSVFCYSLVSDLVRLGVKGKCVV